MKLVSLENLTKYNELLNQKTVRSVNSVKPDSTGNVNLRIPNVTSVIGLPDYENPVTIVDIANTGFNQETNIDYTFTEDGYLHYRLLSGANYDYDSILFAYLEVNANTVYINERSRSPSASDGSTTINGMIPVPKGAILHISYIKCGVNSYNCIEFFPLKNSDVIQADQITSAVSGISESFESTDSLQEIEIDLSKRYNKILLNASETLLKISEFKQTDSDVVLKLDLFLEQGTGTNTVTWPENIKWENGVKPVLALDKGNTDYICLVSLDSGKTFYGYSKAVWLKYEQ